MTETERRDYGAEVRGSGMPVNSLVCTCLGLSDFNPAVRGYHIERAKNVLDLASEFPSARNLCFVPGEYMFQKRLIPAESEWRLVVDATQQVGRHAAERARACDRAAAVRLRVHQDAGGHGALPRRRGARERQGDGRHLAFLADADSPGRARPAQGPDRPGSCLRLRRRQSWRPAAGPGKHPVRRVYVRHPRHGLRRRSGDRARISPNSNRMRDWVAEAYASTLKEMRAVGVR